MSLRMYSFLLHGLDLVSALFWILIFYWIARRIVRNIKGTGKKARTPRGIRKRRRSLECDLKKVRICENSISKDGTPIRKMVGVSKAQYKDCERQARIQVVKRFPAWKQILFKEEYWILAALFLMSSEPDTTDAEKSAKWESLISDYIVDREYYF